MKTPSKSSKTGESEPALRADAQRNRARLLVAADAVFAAHGIDASMDDVARQAQVGIGTLYRHFPTREALLAATLADRMRSVREKGESLVGSETPAAAFEEILGALVELARTYRGLDISLQDVLRCDTPSCHDMTAMTTRLLEAAQAAGEIRAEVEVGDVDCMVIAIALAARQTPADPARVRRLTAMFVDGLRTPPRAEAHAPQVSRTRAPAKKAAGRARSVRG
ncbi:Transcriptional regulator, TetR family protein [Minicystis rosea]|nr:Transcriptional regulator, TetR family protein [Minicystis rosea]